MPILQKTFVKVVPNTSIELIENAFKEIDQNINNFLTSQHWSQSRDCFQTVVGINDSVVITRTLVYTTEQLAFAPTARPPVN